MLIIIIFQPSAMETSGVGDIGENDGFGGGAALPGAAAPHLRLGLGGKKLTSISIIAYGIYMSV